MNPENGDYAARIEQLTRRAQAAHSPAAAAAAAAGAPATAAPSAAQPLPADHGLGPLHPKASRRHAPPEERRMVALKVKRSRWARLLVGVGLFLAGNVLAMLYIGLMGSTERDLGFDVLFTLTWLAPFVAWFGLRHRRLGEVEVKGYPLHTLAVMDAGLGEPCITLRVSDEDMVVADTVWLTDGKEAEQLEIVAADDLIIEIDALLIRAEAPSSEPDNTSHGEQALTLLRRQVASQLCLPADRLPILSPTVSENFDDGITASIDYAEIIVKGGQRLDTDAVCDAVASAMTMVQQRYRVTLDA